MMEGPETMFGRRVIGEAEYRRRKEDKLTGRASIYGKRITGGQLASPSISGEEVSSKDASMPLTQLGALLTESPHMLDRQVDAEFQRSEGPRAGALRLFIAHEQKKEEPRGDVIALLERALTERAKS